MPFSFENNCYYNVDYDNFRMYLQSFSLFKEPINSFYANKWVDKLLNIDMVLKNMSKERMYPYIDKIYNHSVFRNQHFRKNYIIGNNTIEIYFNIPEIIEITRKELIGYKSSKVKTIEILFSGYYDYELPTISNCFVPSKDPIIMVEFNSIAPWLLIDGNHRLSFHAKNNISDIDVVYIKSIDVVNNNYSCFATEYDKLIYILINEFRYLSLLREDFSEEKLLSFSYLFNNKFLFGK